MTAPPWTARINIAGAHEIVDSLLVRPTTGTFIRAGDFDPRRKGGRREPHPRQK